MINSITITGVKFDLDETTKRYVIKKIGRLDRYLPRHARKSATAEVILREVNKAHGNKYPRSLVSAHSKTPPNNRGCFALQTFYIA